MGLDGGAGSGVFVEWESRLQLRRPARVRIAYEWRITRNFDDGGGSAGLDLGPGGSSAASAGGVLLAGCFREGLSPFELRAPASLFYRWVLSRAVYPVASLRIKRFASPLRLPSI